MKQVLLFAALLAASSAARMTHAADAAPDDEAYRPHTPTLVFYVSGVVGQTDLDTIRAAVPGKRCAMKNSRHQRRPPVI